MNYKDVDLTRFIAFLENIKEVEVYAEERHDSHETIMASFINQLSPMITKGGKILDVGCGQGYALELFKKKGFKPVGITIGREDYNFCKEKGLDVEIMDQSFLTFPEDMFDFIWCRHALEHSIMPFFTLSEFYRVLKTNGLLYVEVPYPDTCWDHQKNLNHYSVFGKSSWVSLIERTGFKVLDTSDIDLTATMKIKDSKDKFLAILAKKI